MSLRDVLIVLLVLILISFLFRGVVPILYTGPIGAIVLIVLLIVLLRDLR